jgi:hypothetical protein
VKPKCRVFPAEKNMTIRKYPKTEFQNDIISELSGIDSKHRISSKYAAKEILHQGQSLFDFVLDKALWGNGNVAVRCAEACERAARENPALAAKRSKDIISFVMKNPSGNLRYFTAAMLKYAKIPKKQSEKCASMLEKWLCEEKGKGPRACYLETIASLAENNEALVPLASRAIEEALKSPVASFSARARQIVLRTIQNSKFKIKNSRGNMV